MTKEEVRNLWKDEQFSTVKRDTKFSVFVFGPTRASYDELDSKLANALVENVKALKQNGEKDIGDLEKSGTVFPSVLLTGAPKPQFSVLTLLMANVSKETPIHVVFSGHGSPGAKGRIGMGKYSLDLVAAPEKHYRISADELGSLVIDGMYSARRRKITFEFRCCNSAYVPVDKHSFDPSKHCTLVESLSFIGIFFSKVIGTFNRASVVGYHGYYQWTDLGPVVKIVEDAKGISADLGKVTINQHGRALLSSEKSIKALAANKELDAYFS